MLCKLNTYNHHLKFTYKLFGYENDLTVWNVFANGQDIGRIKKAAGGWTGWRMENPCEAIYTEVTYRTGPRRYVAEHLAMLAGLLDRNYNTI